MTTENNALTPAVLEPIAPPSAGRSPAIFASSQWEMSQRIATALSRSTLIPSNFQNNLPNCLIALEMAERMGASPMMVMQNLYIVHGKPAWSSQFVIAAINSTGRFSPLRFELTGEGDKRSCTAWAVELATRERLEGPPVTIAMSKAEGWFSKNGSKWQTMPELMLRYRSATFFGRLYAPEVLMGMRDDSEIIDVDSNVTPIERAQVPAIASVTTTPPLATDDKGAKKTPRAKKTPANAEPSTATTPPPNDPPGPVGDTPDSLAARAEAKLAADNYTAQEFISVAIRNNWAETTTTAIAEISNANLQVLLDNWDDTKAEMDAARAK